MFDKSVLHLSALDSGTGAANAAARIHSTMRRLNVDSKMLVCHQRSSIPHVAMAPRSIVQRLLYRIQVALERRMLSKVPTDYVLSTGFFGQNIARLLSKNKSDILQLHWIGGNSFRLSSLMGVKVPVVWRMPDMWSFSGIEHLCPDATRLTEGYIGGGPSGQAGADLDRRVWKVKARLYESLDKIVFVAPSQWLANCARESKLLRDKRVEIIPTSCDVEKFKPLDRRACKAALGLPDQAPLILTGATCMRTKWKGGDLLIAALNRLAARPGFRANVVCFGQGAEAFQQQCELPVVSMGSISDARLMAILYSAADVFVAPSRMENMANTVLESLACGTPSVAFRIGGMPDMISHFANGYLANSFDTEDLAEGIRWVVEDADPNSLRHTARDRILAKHLPEDEARSYLRIYESLLSE